MKNKEAAAYLRDILQAIQAIRDYTSALDAQSFAKKRMAVDAVIRQLAIIGEAVAHLPVEMRGKEAEIPWKKIVGMRNKMVHAYSEVDHKVVWDVVGSDLDALEKCVKRLLKEEQQNT